MKLLETAVTERVKQLTRQQSAQTNPIIKQILGDEIKALQTEWANKALQTEWANPPTKK